MEIVKVGVVPKDVIWEGVCVACGSIVRARQEELSNIVFAANNYDDSYSWEVCPVCGSGEDSHNMLFKKMDK